MEITETTKNSIRRFFREEGHQAGEFLTSHFPPVPVRDGSEMPSIPDPAVPIICEAVMVFVAELIQAYIDAGSERDATMENENLFMALEGEIGGWADDYTKYEEEA